MRIICNVFLFFCFFVFCGFLCLFYPVRVYAIDYNINIKGNVYISPCTVNDNNVVTVDFGNVSTSDIGTDKNNKEISLTVSCGYYGGEPYIRIDGTKLENNDNILATDIPGFGIALYQGTGTTTKLTIGDGKMTGHGAIGYKITNGLSGTAGNLTFTFTAIPYSKTPNVLESSDFSSMANLTIIYQ